MDKVAAHMDLCKEINALYAKKNHDYGDSFHATYLEEGMAMPRIRLNDKLSRFKTLTLKGGQQIMDESVRDTLIDLANYAIMTILEMDIQSGKIGDPIVPTGWTGDPHMFTEKHNDQYKKEG